MQLRCYRCGWSFAIKQDEIAFALQALEQEGGGHYDVRCPRCRHANRISIQQLQRASGRRQPAAPEQPGPPSAPEETSEPGVAPSEPSSKSANSEAPAED